MVDLSGGPDGPIEHGFSNTVFIIPAIVVVGLAVSSMGQSGIDRRAVQDQLDGFGSIEEGVEIPEDFVHEAPPTSLPNLLNTLDNIDGISPEEKLELRKEILKAMAGGEYEEAVSSGYISETLVFILALAVIVSILAFFGLKLYRSLSEKERKREEKRRLKQQKKKK